MIQEVIARRDLRKQGADLVLSFHSTGGFGFRNCRHSFDLLAILATSKCDTVGMLLKKYSAGGATPLGFRCADRQGPGGAGSSRERGRFRGAAQAL